jgi:hypothetical protein
VEPRLLILAAALVFFVVALVAFLVSAVRSVRKHEEFEPLNEVGDWPALPAAPGRAVDTNLMGLDLDLRPDSPSAALLTPLSVGNWQPPVEPAPGTRLGEVSLAQRIAAYQPTAKPVVPTVQPAPSPSAAAPASAPQPGPAAVPVPQPAPAPVPVPQPAPAPVPVPQPAPAPVPAPAPAAPAPAPSPQPAAVAGILASVPLVIPEVAVAPPVPAVACDVESALDVHPMAPPQPPTHLMQSEEVAHSPAIPAASAPASMPSAVDLGAGAPEVITSFEWLPAETLTGLPAAVGSPAEEAEPVAPAATAPLTAPHPVEPIAAEVPVAATWVPPTVTSAPIPPAEQATQAFAPIAAPTIEPVALAVPATPPPALPSATPSAAPTLEPSALAPGPTPMPQPAAPAPTPALTPRPPAPAPTPARTPEPPAATVAAAPAPRPAAQAPALTPVPARERPAAVVRPQPEPEPAPSPAPRLGMPAERSARPRAHVRAPLEPGVVAGGDSIPRHAQPSSFPPHGLRAQAPPLTMAAPVEMWFGEARVGVKAGTKTYQQFRKYADILLGDLKDTDASSR